VLEALVVEGSGGGRVRFQDFAAAVGYGRIMFSLLLSNQAVTSHRYSMRNPQSQFNATARAWHSAHSKIKMGRHGVFLFSCIICKIQIQG